MVNVVICGPPGSGKSQLARALHKKCSNRQNYNLIDETSNTVLERNFVRSRIDYDRNDSRFADIQKQIATAIISRDITLAESHKSFINANGLIEPLVLLKTCLPHTDDYKNTLDEHGVDVAIEIYRSSLVLLLGPLTASYDDGVCLRLSASDWKARFADVMDECRIPYTPLDSTDQNERLDVAMRAIRRGEMPIVDPTPYLRQRQNGEDYLINLSFFLEPPKSTNETNIPLIIIHEHGYKQDWKSYKRTEINRFIHKHGHEKLICLHFDIKVKSLKAQQLLLKGIHVNGDSLSFLGCSTSGLKERKCFMFRGSDKDVSDVINESGRFSQIKTVSKYLARVGLLFSAVTLTDIRIEPDMIREISDIEQIGRNFTDGCGSVSEALAKEIRDSLSKDESDKTVTSAHQDAPYLPSVYQIRLQGYKGVLTLNPRLPGRCIEVRPSMEKFKTDLHPMLGICDVSRPYEFGHLNVQFVQLLSGLGVSSRVLYHRFQQHCDDLERMTSDCDVAVRILQWQNYPLHAQTIVKYGGITKVPEHIRNQLKLESKVKEIQNREKIKLEKLRILIPKSRNLFGVCDQIGVLQYGQCFLRVTQNGKPTSIRGQVVVTKNPCYLTGDIRVLTAVTDSENPDLKKLNHLVDCIVFPTRGKCPHPHEIAGSDLDGDKFFVTWDSDLIPPNTTPPYDFPAFEQKPEKITREKILSYFSKQNEGGKTMGKVNSLFNRWADDKGVTSQECECLGKLFSRAVDASKSGDAPVIPANLTKIDKDRTPNPKFVWVRMKSEALRRKEEFAVRKVSEIIATNEDRDIEAQYGYQGQPASGDNQGQPGTSGNQGKSASGSDQGHPETGANQYQPPTSCYQGQPATNDDQEQPAKGGNQEDISEEFVFDVLENSYENIPEFDKFQLLWLWLQQTTRDDEIVDVIMTYLSYINFSYFTLDEKRDAICRGISAKFVLNALNRSRILQQDELSHFSMDRRANTWSYFFHCPAEDLKWSDLNKAFSQFDNTLIVLRLEDDVIIGVQIMTPLHEGQELPLEGGTVSSFFYSRHFGHKFNLILGNSYGLDFSKNLLQIYENGKRNQSFIWLKAADSNFADAKSRKDLDHHAVSVALQRYNASINRNNHPLITKKAFDEIEVYVRCMASDSPYFDIYDGNDNLPVADLSDVEIETEDDDEINFAEIFPKTKFDIDISSAEEFDKMLRHAAVEGKPYLFHHILQTANEMTDQAVFAFDELLKSMTCRIVPSVLPQDLKELVTSILLKVQPKFCAVGPDVVLSIFSGLCRLGLQVRDYLEDSITTLRLHEFIGAVSRWDLLYNLHQELAVQFIEQLEVGFIGSESRGLGDIPPTLLYLFRMAKLHALHLMRQVRESKTTMRQNAQSATTTERTTNSSLKFLKVDKSTEMGDTVTFHANNAVKSSRITNGQFVTVSRQRDVCDPDVTVSMVTCCLAQVQSICVAPCCVELKIIGQIPDVLKKMSEYEGIKYWQIDLIGNIVTYERVNFALNKAREEIETSQILPILSGCEIKTKQTPARAKVKLGATGTLNQSQLHAALMALNHRVSLIHGPPGTGKTTVACHIVSEYIKQMADQSEQILIVAETNVAVDNLVKRLRHEYSVLRIGPAEGVDPEVREVSLEGQMKRIEEVEAKRATVRDVQGRVHRNTRLMNRVIRAAQIILTTCAGAGDRCLESLSFPLLVVDEATQTLETTLLCGVAHGARQLVMIGDPKQLGPVISQSEDEDLSDLSQTAFHRLYEGGRVPVCMLNTQYRMHESIATFPSQEFYHGELSTAPSIANRPGVIFPWPKPNAPFCFIDAKSWERKCGTSYVNEAECDVICQVIKTLQNFGKKEQPVSIEDIGVISLYRGQVVKLQEKIQKGIMVSSVDGFQGQEKDVIIVSTVRSNDRGILGFSDDRNRVNVLLTRAKRGLVVVGSRRTLVESKLWAEWLKQAPVLDREKLVPMK